MAEPIGPGGAPKVFVVRERLWQSVLSDTYTFAVLAALPWFNHAYCGGSGWIDFAIAFAWFVMISARLSGKTKEARKSPAEVRAWLDVRQAVFKTIVMDVAERIERPAVFGRPS
jgi:hypothetical protein